MNDLTDTISLFDQPTGNPLSGEILSVSQFNSLIKDVLSNLGVFKVKGEITELKISKNKGLYITLSDGKANLKIGGYAPTVKGVGLVEKDMSVIITGVADLYVPYGTFSLKAFSIEPVGEGALAIAYSKLKEKLEKEGLFADEHKQKLPRYITKVALLTGEDSAAYSDFIKILQERETGVEILYYPVLVQGTKSVQSIQKALFDVRKKEVDLVVLTRGGGSLEDLKSFNDEELARLIFTSPKPLIAGVGHEKDESIADFVSDLRASTPSQAAYYIVEQNQRFLDEIEEYGNQIFETLRVDIQESRHDLENMIFSIDSQIGSFTKSINEKLSSLERILESYNIEKTLKRGFSVIHKNGKQVSSIKQVSVKDGVDARLADGVLNATIVNIKSIKNGKKKNN
ncbi:exodeoxyribonuclease VII large subunit [Patescibacteria group bacterium]